MNVSMLEAILADVTARGGIRPAVNQVAWVGFAIELD
jgi:hypothetical protein